MLRVLALLRLVVALAAATLASTLTIAGERISDFSLIDQHGKFFQLSHQANFDAIVLMAHEDSRDVRRASRSGRRQHTVQAKTSVFIIDATGETDKSEIRNCRRAYIDLPILMDESQLVARELGIERATDVVIIDPAGAQRSSRPQ